jgi:hypothetical protein
MWTLPRSIFHFIRPRLNERRCLAHFIQFSFGFMYSGDFNWTVSTRIKLGNYRTSVLNLIEIRWEASELQADELKRQIYQREDQDWQQDDQKCKPRKTRCCNSAYIKVCRRQHFTVVNIKIVVFWNAIPCILADWCHFQVDLKMESAGSFKTLVAICQKIWLQIPEAHNLMKLYSTREMVEHTIINTSMET